MVLNNTSYTTYDMVIVSQVKRVECLQLGISLVSFEIIQQVLAVQ